MKKAQQIIEFLLITPFIIAILGIMTELAYAFNINMTLQKATEYAAGEAYLYPGEFSLETKIKNSLIKYLDEHYVPYTDSINIQIVKTGQNAVVLSSYTYKSAFILPNMFVKIIPEEFNFSGIASLSNAYVKEGKFELDDSETKFFASSRGILKNDEKISSGLNARDCVAFLVPIQNPIDPAVNAFALVKFDGTPFIDNAYVSALKDINSVDGTYIASLFDYLAQNNITSAFIIDSSSLGTLESPFFDISNALGLKNQETSKVFGLYEDISSTYKNNTYILNAGTLRVYSNGEFVHDMPGEGTLYADLGETVGRN